MASNNPYEVPTVPKFVDFSRMQAGELDDSIGDDFFDVEETAVTMGNGPEDKEKRPIPREPMTQEEKRAEAIEWIGLDRLAMFEPRQTPGSKGVDGGATGRAPRRSLSVHMGPETRSRTRMLQHLGQSKAEEGAKLPTGAIGKTTVNARGTKATATKYVVTETKEEAAEGGAAVRASRDRTRRVIANAAAPKGPTRVVPRSPSVSKKAVDTPQKLPATARKPSGIVPKSAKKLDASPDSAKGARRARTAGVDKVAKRFGALKVDKSSCPPKHTGSKPKLPTLQPLLLPPPPRPRRRRAAAAAAEHADVVRPKVDEPTDPHEDSVNSDREDQ